MVIHALTYGSSAASTLHGFVANIVETSMISLFIALGQSALPICNETVDNAWFGLTLMKETIKAPFPGMFLTKGAWDEYITVMELVLEGQRDLLNFLGRFETCKGYWDEWGT